MASKLRTWFSLQAVVLAALLAGTVGIAQAHVLKQDNGMSAVLHIPPEDNPQAGQTTELDVAFYNQANTFKIGDCDCNVTVKQNGQTIQTTPLRPQLAGANLDTIADVNFPKAGIYDVIVTGSAKDNIFGSFTLDYLERVTGAPGTASASSGNGSEAIIVGAASLVVVGMIGQSTIKSGGRYAKQEPVESKTVAKPRAKAKTRVK